MSIPTFKPPMGFNFSQGDSIHTSVDPYPHLSGNYGGPTVHVPYYGQTTLGMFDRGCGGAHRLGDVSNLADQYPGVFKGSGLKW